MFGPVDPALSTEERASSRGGKKGGGASRVRLSALDIPPPIIVRTQTHGKPTEKAESKQDKQQEFEYPQKLIDFPLAVTEPSYWNWVAAHPQAGCAMDITSRADGTEGRPVCFYCSHGEFPGPRISLPHRYDEQRALYHVWGVFCSLNCVKKYAMVTRRIQQWRVLPLITLMAYHVYGVTDPILPAPDRELLQMYAGPAGLTIQQFRDTARSEVKILRIVDPPFLWCPMKISVEPLAPAAATAATALAAAAATTGAMPSAKGVTGSSSSSSTSCSSMSSNSKTAAPTSLSATVRKTVPTSVSQAAHVAGLSIPKLSSFYTAAV
jgi:hypothetical protein